MDARRTIGQASGVLRASAGLVGLPVRRAGAVVFTYHGIVGEGAHDTDEVSPRALRADLEAAKAWGTRFVDLSELMARFFAGERLDDLAVVTFDDARAGVHRYALAILEDLEIPAAVFAVSCRLGAGPPEWEPGTDRMMTKVELTEVAEAGLAVYSHTRTHPDLTDVTEEQLRGELAGARDDLEELLRRPVEYLSYPFGRFDRRVRRAVEAAGYRAAFTFLPGRIVPTLDRYRLPRLPMPSRHNRARLAYLLGRPSSSFRDPQPDAVTA